MRNAAILLLMTLLVSCGYRVPGTSDAWVGGEARAVYVQLFVNRTAEPYLENFVTDDLLAEMARSRAVTLTDDPAQAGLVLTGEVREFSSATRALGATDRVTDYRATMTVSARLERKGSGELLWQETLQRSADFRADDDKSRQVEGRGLAAREASRRLAEDLMAHMLNAF